MCSSARYALVLALLVGVPACKKGTYAIVRVDRGVATPAAVAALRLDLTLNGVPGQSVTLSEPGGAPIQLPTDTSLRLLHGAGTLGVTAVALDGSGVEVDRGSSSAEVAVDTTVTVSITLGVSSVDLGDMSPPGVAQLPLTVTKAGTGSGRVTSTPAGLDCGPQCTAMFDAGAVVTLTPAPDKGSGFTGWSGDCTGSDACVVTMSQARNVTATFVKANFVFVTSMLQPNGNLGGLAGADAICKARAMAASLPGSYVAYLSAGTTIDGVSRLGNANGWVRVDGKPFAASRDGLFTNRQTFYPAMLDEFGNPVNGDFVATAGRGISGSDCGSWTQPGSGSSYIKSDSGAGGGDCWNFMGTATCDKPFRLYCFGTDNDATFVVPKAAGRLAFVTTGVFDPKSGIGGADTLCGSEATGAGLSGTFKAFLATTSASAASRFSSSGPVWVRTDGVALANSAAEFLMTNNQTSHWIAALNVSADGKTYFGGSGNDIYAWSGTSDAAMAGGAVDTCMNWSVNSSTAPSATGAVGHVCLAYSSGVNTPAGRTDAPFGSPAGPTCDPSAASGNHLYCLQQ